MVPGLRGWGGSRTVYSCWLTTLHFDSTTGKAQAAQTGSRLCLPAGSVTGQSDGGTEEEPGWGGSALREWVPSPGGAGGAPCRQAHPDRPQQQGLFQEPPGPPGVRPEAGAPPAAPSWRARRGCQDIEGGQSWREGALPGALRLCWALQARQMGEEEEAETPGTAGACWAGGSDAWVFCGCLAGDLLQGWIQK